MPALDPALVLPHRARGYAVDGDVTVNDTMLVSRTFARTADGSLVLTIGDLVAWAGVLRAGGILTPAS